jgi:hypothetical protein
VNNSNGKDSRARGVTAIMWAAGVGLLFGTAATAAPRTNFVQRADLTSGSSPVAVAAADLDGDGLVDLAVANYDSSDVSIFWGNGAGTFVAAPAALAVGEAGTESPLAVAIADVTGDGRPDILTANEFANTVSVLPNQGSRVFGPAIQSPTGGSPEGLVVADVNGDHILDVVTPNFLDDTVTVLLGRGDGSFASACSNQPSRTCGGNSDCPAGGTCAPRAIPVGAQPKALAAADLNTDGNTDLVVALARSSDVQFVGSVMVLRGSGDGNFVPQPELQSSTFDFGWTVAMVAADVNSDGNPDVIVSNENGDSLSVLAGNGDLTFESAVAVAVGVGTGPVGVVVADFNGDGVKDIATSASFQDKVTVFAGLGNGQFGPAQDFALAAGGLPAGMALSDFNRDSRIDLAVANMQNDTMTLLVNPRGGDCSLNGSVTVDEILTMVNVVLGDRVMADCLAGDVNGDGEITVDEILLAVNNALIGCAA